MNEYISQKELKIGYRLFVHGTTFSLQFGPACPADSVEQVDWAELGTEDCSSCKNSETSFKDLVE